MSACAECGEQVSRLRRAITCAVCERAIEDRLAFGEVAPLAGRRALRAVKILVNPLGYQTRRHYLNALGNALEPVAELYGLELPDWPSVTFPGEPTIEQGLGVAFPSSARQVRSLTPAGSSDEGSK